MNDGIFSMLGTLTDPERREVEAIRRRRGDEWVHQQLRAWSLERGELEKVAAGMFGFDPGPLAYLRDQVASVEGIVHGAS